jgi:para-aminobenzoate synthetase/4-amino-4-deoxychorismate lyase
MPLAEEDARQAWQPLPASWRSTAFRQDGTVLLESSLPDRTESHSYLFTGASQILMAKAGDDLPSLFEGIENALKQGKWVAGWMAYEAGAHFLGLPQRSIAPMDCPLAIFGVYESPRVFDHLAQQAVEETAATPAALPMAPMLRMDRVRYTAAIARIQAWIAAGETYQVNFTTSVTTPYTGQASTLYEALRVQQPCSYGGVVNLQPQQTILSFSPELFFRASPGGKLTTRPMKGTAARSGNPADDHALAEQLRNDEKNRAEHVMIVDLLRNDLGRICAPGTVQVDRLFDVETYATLLQMTSTITGQLPGALPWYEVFRALFPSGSITGAPKRHTMELIDQLEDHPRGIYTGALGYFAPDRSACFNVAIRTAVLTGNTLELGVGGGIVADSTSDGEYNECLLKTAFLQRAAQPIELMETMRWQRQHGEAAPLWICHFDRIEAQWRNLLLADAATETIGRDIPLLAAHMTRLQASATALGFSFDLQQILATIKEATANWADQPQRIRLLLHRDGFCTLQHAEAPAWPQEIKLLLAGQRLQSSAPHLRHKTTFRPEYDPEFRVAHEAGFDEAIFLNQRDEIAEGCITSLLVAVGGAWFTPPLATGCLPGVYRGLLLDAGVITERALTLHDLRHADHVCLCNALRGVGAVGSLHLPGGERIFYKAAQNAPRLPAW